jgi:putative NAD(P)H nitroreductase
LKRDQTTGTIEPIKKRYSINFFQPGRNFPRKKMIELSEIANLAPSSFNLHPWKVIIVRDPGKKKAVRK